MEGVDTSLAQVSDTCLFLAVVAYSLAMIGYAAEFSFGRRPALADIRTPLRGRAGRGAVATAIRPAREDDRGSGFGLVAGRVAIVVTLVGWMLHVTSVATRGIAAGRVPWGNMYEFSSMVSLIAVTAFLVILVLGYPVRHLGAFVMFPVVVYLGVAVTVLYVPDGPLIPALQSYWLQIHVSAAILATGVFMVSAVTTVLYLLKERYESRSSLGPGAAATAETGRRAGLMRALPPASVLDTLTYRIVAFAFPVWTFAIICGAIWAESAWGRYWGWDPKETWSFITWVIYAGYLHARGTAGWRGRKAAYVSLAGFSALMIDYFVVNIWVSGLHSYAGL